MIKRTFLYAAAALALVCAAFWAYSYYGAPRKPAAAAPASLKIATYNMQAFGKTKAGRPATLAALARIGASFDAMAVQEIGSGGSSASGETAEAVLAAYVARMNELAGADAFAAVGSGQFAVVYRKDRLSVVSWEEYSGGERFAYSPLAVAFKTIGAAFDFVLVDVHVRPNRAETEIPALAAVMAEVAARFGESDVVCAGDFNADGSYYDEGRGPALAGFSPAEFITVVPNGADTTVASGQNAYDRIELSASLREDYTGAWGVMRPGALWDLSVCEGPAGKAGTEAALSDHYPVWAEFSTGRDTD
jgi:endonuclease/exonuclease/phosphatase family metal-dependent hydrolase